MTAPAGPFTTTVKSAFDTAQDAFAAFDRTPAPDLWRAAQQLLQQVLQRPELSGQALIGEARRLGALSRPDAHALTALAAFGDRTTTSATSEAERIMIREAWMALQHAVPADTFEPETLPRSPYAPPVAPPGTPGALPATPLSPYAPPGTAAYTPASTVSAPTARPYAPREPAASPADAVRANAASANAASANVVSTNAVPEDAADAPVTRTRRRWGLITAATLLVVALAGGGAWWFIVGRSERMYTNGVTAYQRGAREVARAAFVELAQTRPDDARPLVYLGRMSREDGDLARARRFLTTAVRVAPGSAIAARELGSVMLADAQPEIARRFYVRAIELDPADRVAQGFLGCALYRLQRYDEARRWAERAGSGDWERCIGPPPAVPFGSPVPSPLPPR